LSERIQRTKLVPIHHTYRGKIKNNRLDMAVPDLGQCCCTNLVKGILLLIGVQGRDQTVPHARQRNAPILPRMPIHWIRRFAR